MLGIRERNNCSATSGVTAAFLATTVTDEYLLSGVVDLGGVSEVSN